MSDAQLEATIFISIALFIWIGALFLVARFSPWHKIRASIDPHLAPQAYGGDKKVHRFASATVGSSRYKNCLTITFNQYGFNLKVSPFLIPGHPQLFIPWGAIETIQNDNAWFQTVAVITLKNDAKTQITVYGRLFENNSFLPSRLKTASQ